MTVYASSKRALLAGLSSAVIAALAFFTSALPVEADPDVPTVTIGQITPTYAKVSWSTNQWYDFFHIQMAPVGEHSGYIEIDSPGDNGWYQWATLTPGTTYTFAVQGCHNLPNYMYSCGAFGEATIKTPAVAPPTPAPPAIAAWVPTPPQHVQATAKSSSEIDLSWQPDPGASGFSVQVNDGRVYSSPNNSGGIVIPNLSAHTAYTFTVCSIYSGSKPCANTGATTKGDVIAPTAVAARVQRPGVNVTWDRPSDSDDQWFEVQNFQTPTGALELHVPRVATWVVVSGRLNANRRSYDGTFAGGQVRVCTGNDVKTVCSAPVNTQGSRTISPIHVNMVM